jgi:type II secretory pathway pseudopilin PulG
LTQLIVVLSMVGVLAAYVIPKIMPSAGKGTAAYQALKLADNLRHTRMLAVSWGKALKFQSDSATYRVTCSTPAACNNATPTAGNCPNPTAVVIDHGHNGPFCITLEGGVSLSGPTEIEFDLLGRTLTSGSSTYQLFAGNTLMATVNVAANTGFVSTVLP